MRNSTPKHFIGSKQGHIKAREWATVEQIQLHTGQPMAVIKQLEARGLFGTAKQVGELTYYSTLVVNKCISNRAPITKQGTAGSVPLVNK